MASLVFGEVVFLSQSLMRRCFNRALKGRSVAGIGIIGHISGPLYAVELVYSSLS